MANIIELLKRYKNILIFLAVFVAAFAIYRVVINVFFSEGEEQIETVAVQPRTEDTGVGKEFVETLLKLNTIKIKREDGVEDTDNVFKKKIYQDLQDRRIVIRSDQVEKRRNNPFTIPPSQAGGAGDNSPSLFQATQSSGGLQSL